ncbi:lactonase family protein [Actinophytocola sp.]|uniref:lactonase family protein n=1 Tax=Actinophytocola sp. TaxID=1872138 RepID=UPI002ED59E55
MTSRRGFLLGSGMLAASPFLADAAAADPAAPLIAYVGCRTTKLRNASGKGITVWRVGRDGWEQIQLVEAEDDDPTTPHGPDAIPINPSFLALDPTGRFLYTVHGDATKVTSFAVAADGTLTRLNTVDTGRPNGVHLAVDPSGRWLVVAHLSAAGSVTTLPIHADGSLGDVAGSLVPPGTPGPHKTAQLGPNPHHAPFDPTGRWVLVPDRGLDRVFVAKLDAATGGLTVHGWGSSRELDGPRHVAVNPVLPYLYAINELRSTLTAYRWDAAAGTLSPHRTVSATAPNMVTNSRGGEIAVSPSGRFVYVSNRSGTGDETPGGPDPDTIGAFRVDRATGDLTPVEWVSTQGIRPRHFGFAPDGRRLYAANEVTHTIVEFAVDQGSGRLRPTGEVIETPSPVCVLFRSVR